MTRFADLLTESRRRRGIPTPEPITEQQAKASADETILKFIRAYGPVTIPAIQAHMAEQSTLGRYETDQILTRVLNSPEIELYDVTSDGIAAFWTSLPF